MVDQRHAPTLSAREKPSMPQPTIPPQDINDHLGFLGRADDSTETLRRVLDRLRAL